MELNRLSSLVDLIYVHVDLSILERIEIKDLSDLIQEIFTQPKTAALGIASCPENPDSKILEDANRIIKSAVQGVISRQKPEVQK